MKNIIVDFHSHGQMKAYANSFKPGGPTYFNSPNRRDKNSVWRTDWPTARDIKKNVYGLFGLTHFTQADMITCLRGNVQVSFSSLYPLEKRFTLPFGWSGPLADGLVNCVTQFGKPRINFIQGIQDYFLDLENEYKFQKAHTGKVKEVDGQKYLYQFVNSYDELECLIVESEHSNIKKMAVINSIEGAHCFGTGIAPYKLPERLDQILERIRIVKEEWEHPPFFITLAHHYYNEICGHAKSLGFLSSIIRQNKGLNQGFTEEGKQILHLLLDKEVGRRVLIDIKHMSLKARKQYYRILEEQYDFSVPIMISHGCVTGYRDRTKSRNHKSAVAGSPHKKFCTDDINFYDFELINIKHSEGIFGIQLSENRIGSRIALRKAKRVEPRKILFHTAKLVWNQIQHVAEVLDEAGLFAWDIQSLGSDFDGIINPIDGYFTAMHFDNLSHFLLMHAHNYVTQEMPIRIKNNFNQIGAEEIIDRFLRENALAFLRKNFKPPRLRVPVESNENPVLANHQ